MSRIHSVGCAALLATGGLLGVWSSSAAQAPAPKEVAKQAMQAQGFIKEFGTMWTFDAPPLEYWKAQYDFAPDQEWLDRVRLASVRLPGCSSSFVSENGLVMTNHHCARGCISAVSPADTNYQETGFIANSGEEERACPGMWVDQLQSIEDVTARVRGAVKATVPAEQVAQRDAITETIEDECRSETGLTCQVVRFYQGGMYSLYRYKRFDDVRLVFAPEGKASFFGGDPDNFTYPRYDLDVTLVRAYENGQPFQPTHYFPWSENGAAEGELVFVTGNPGSTGRLLTMAQMEYLRDVSYPARLRRYERRLDILRELSSQSDEARRQNENQVFGLENAHKAISGYLRGLLDPEIMGKKKAFEADFRTRIMADADLKQKYGPAWDNITKAQKELASFAVESQYHTFGGSQLLNLAGGIVRWPAQAALSDADRLPQYRGGGLDRVRGFILRDQPIDAEADKLALASFLRAAQKELPANDPFLETVLAGRSPEVAAEALINTCTLTDAAAREALLEGGTAAIEASNDPMIVLARKIEPMTRTEAERAAALNDVISANAELVGQAIFAAYGKALPPDATFTLRISDGVVKRYPMNGTFAPYKTTFYGLYARAEEFDHQPPWNLPQRWLDRRDRLNLATPINFVSTNDIIGGNSGSPVINRNAEVVGLIFDGNIEMLPNRFIFTDEVSRSVSVHSAGIVEALRKMYDADRIADELQGVAQPATR
jgi:hypothetical protein